MPPPWRFGAPAKQPLGPGPAQIEGVVPPTDPTIGDPTAMRGRTSQLADWVVQQASSAIGGVRNVLRPAQTSTPMSQPLPSPGPTPQTVPAPTPGGSGTYNPGAYTGGNGFTRAIRDFWFGPGQPMTPMAPYADVAGRAFDYPTGYNMGSRPRQYTKTSFEQLRALADNLDIARLCIETRKDQMGALTWSVLPFQQAGELTRPKADERCRSVEQFLRRPDKRNTWEGWMRQLLEEQMVIDAASIYVRRTRGGDVYSLEVVDGALIKPLLDVTGRTPMAPEAAYQQILKGMPAVEYTSDEMIYAPRNPRAHEVYGLSNVEQILMTVNIAIRREVVKLKYFTENNIPEAIAGTPVEWSPDQVAKFQTIWDAMVVANNQQGKSGMRFVPGGVNVQQTRSDAMLMGQFDEWIARVVCFCFSLPPTAFVQQQNRATAETAKDSALEEGLAPMMTWFKGVMDRIIQQVFGYTDLEFVWDDIKAIEVAEERNQDRADVAAGIMSIDEARAKRGLDPIGIANFIPGGPNGVIFLDDLARAHAQGLLQIQPPAPPQFDQFGNPVPQGMPPDGMGAPTIDGTVIPPDQGQLNAPGSAPGFDEDWTEANGTPVGSTEQSAPLSPGAGPTPQPDDPLAGIPPDILAAIGLGPQGSAGRAVDITQDEAVETDPGLAFVPSPQVLATLRGAEALQRGRA